MNGQMDKVNYKAVVHWCFIALMKRRTDQVSYILNTHWYGESKSRFPK